MSTDSWRPNAAWSAYDQWLKRTNTTAHPAAYWWKYGAVPVDNWDAHDPPVAMQPLAESGSSAETADSPALQANATDSPPLPEVPQTKREPGDEVNRADIQPDEHQHARMNEEDEAEVEHTGRNDTWDGFWPLSLRETLGRLESDHDCPAANSASPPQTHRYLAHLSTRDIAMKSTGRTSSQTNISTPV